MLALKSRVYILLFILILTFGCSEKRTIVQDNVTANLNINSVAQSENTDILEGNENERKIMLDLTIDTKIC